MEHRARTPSVQYVTVGLAVYFIVLTKMVPAMNAIVDARVRGKPQELGAWNGIVVGLSSWTCAHQSISIMFLGLLAACGFVLPFVIRPTRYLVWAIALAVFLLDVALAGGGYWNMIGGVLKETNNLNIDR